MVVRRRGGSINRRNGVSHQHNGQQTATNAVANSNQAFAGAGTIGTDTYSSSARAFNGVMDEVSVFNYPLTLAQIQQLYANGHQLAQCRSRTNDRAG